MRVLNYNLHNGFSLDGRLDLEALARVVEASEADVVTLQEVSRGWAVAGSAEMLGWLGQRLGMEVAMGPTTTDLQWGNAILSRYPIVATENHSLPSDGLPLRRGFFRAEGDEAYTHPSDAPAQRIDYVWLSPDLAPLQFETIPPTSSDHLPLLAVVRLPRP